MSDLSGKAITIPADLWGLFTIADPRTYAGALDRAGSTAGAMLLRHIQDAIDDQHPPRMDEPGYGERVVATVMTWRAMFVRAANPDDVAADFEWLSVRSGLRYRWSDLVDPRPVDAES